VSVVFLKVDTFQKQQKKLFLPEMVVFANVVEAPKALNMIILFHTLAADRV
jgi:hypothetical protein